MTRRSNVAAGLVACGLIALCGAQAASASSILAYTGNPYTTVVDSPAISGAYDTTMFVSGTIELATALGASFDGAVTPAHFSLNDGRFTVTDRFPSSFFHFTTDATGAITKWYFEVHDNIGGALLIIQSSHDPAVFSTLRDTGAISNSSTGASDAGVVADAGGSWAVAEPASLSLLGVGWLGLRLRSRRRTS